MPIVIKNLVIYFFSPKIFLWKKKLNSSSIFKKVEEEEKEEIKEKRLETTEHSRLKDLFTKIETRER